MTATEAQTEEQTADLFRRYGWEPVKTDAGTVRRGGGKHGSLPDGFPDMLFLLSLPGSALCLCAMVELKTRKGRVRDSQHAYYRHARTLGLSPQIVRTPEEALSLIDEGRRIRSALRVAL
jgi:hypothetical protein